MQNRTSNLKYWTAQSYKITLANVRGVEPGRIFFRSGLKPVIRAGKNPDPVL